MTYWLAVLYNTLPHRECALICLGWWLVLHGVAAMAVVGLIIRAARLERRRRVEDAMTRYRRGLAFLLAERNARN
jgi:hypothetical protein